MIGTGFIAPLMVLLSFAVALLIFPLPDHRTGVRSTLNLSAAVLKVGLVVYLIPIVFGDGAAPEWSMPFLPGIDLVLRVDRFALFFAGLSSLLWLLTTLYAIGYLKGKPHRSRFFGFFSLCVTATVGISFSGNLITFLIFYEMLTLVTYPLVAHRGDAKSLAAARVYLRYALSGGLSVLFGVVWLTVLAGPVDFAQGGVDALADVAASDPVALTLIFALLVGGMGVKAALFPLHGWLPRAMVAPAPVSALLHAVAVVKAGVFGICRVVDDVYGIEVARDLGVLTPLLIIASFTIVYGSYIALRQTDLKARLAYSTVSQVSYVTLGLAMAGVVATSGGIVHLVHQGIMKITLFFCAGLFAEVMGRKAIAELRGLGARMPLTSVAFTVGAFGMIGLPPTAGFISKWQLGQGALLSGNTWVLGVLVASTLLNAAYFLPIVYDLWFRDEEEPEEPEEPGEPDEPGADATAGHSTDRGEVRARRLMLVPALVTTVAVLALGVAASAQYSPLWVAELISEAVFQS